MNPTDPDALRSHTQGSALLVPSAAQTIGQLPLLSLPTSLLVLSPLLDGVTLHLDVACSDIMFALGFVESSLRFGDRSIAPLALLGFLSELAPARCITPLPLEIDRGPAGRLRADLRACGLLRLRSAR